MSMKSLRSRARANSPSNDAAKSSKLSTFSKQCHSKDAAASRNIRSTASTSTAVLSSSYFAAKNKRRSKFYNKTCAERPTELFRTDLISNMTVADSEPLNNQQELIVLTDTWRRDWNDGVQVPVYESDLIAEGTEKEGSVDNVKFSKDASSPSSAVRPPVPIFYEVDEDNLEDADGNSVQRILRSKRKRRGFGSSKDDSASKIGRHCVQYELDDLDLRWLRLINEALFDSSFPRFLLDENQLEKAIERLEIAYALRCADEQESPAFLRQKSDSDAVCDVCRGEFSEEGNLLVFCDRCNVCVHQACYGICRVPSGSWVCRPCSLDLRPGCVLCPNRGGALKPTKSGHVWAHVSCAVWVPEITFGSPSLKEPIVGISRIPEERWMLQCEICEQRSGACIQCTVRNCHVSYHVTCAQRAGWKVTYKEAMPEDDSEDVLENFCKKHSKNWPPNSMEHDMKVEPTEGFCKSAASSVAYRILTRLSYSDLEHVFERMQQIPNAFRRAIFYYWKTKRLSSPEKILIFDIDECQLALERDREAEFICRRVDYLISLRQTLEKTRTLCYMIQKREKLKRQWLNTAADEFDLLLSNSPVSNSEPPGADANVGQHLQAFSLSYQPETWLPKAKKLAELSSLIPSVSTGKTSKPLFLSTHRKRGRPPKVLRRAETQSPLTILNSTSTPRRRWRRKKAPLVRRALSSSATEAHEDEKNDDPAHPSKRKRTPRVQYSPT